MCHSSRPYLICTCCLLTSYLFIMIGQGWLPFVGLFCAIGALFFLHMLARVSRVPVWNLILPWFAIVPTAANIYSLGYDVFSHIAYYGGKLLPFIFIVTIVLAFTLKKNLSLHDIAASEGDAADGERRQTIPIWKTYAFVGLNLYFSLCYLFILGVTMSEDTYSAGWHFLSFLVIGFPLYLLAAFLQSVLSVTYPMYLYNQSFPWLITAVTIILVYSLNVEIAMPAMSWLGLFYTLYSVGATLRRNAGK